MTAGGAIGTIAAFLQTTEKISLLSNEGEALACDLSSVFSCTNVLNAWQSSVFGFSNSLMCMALFTIFATVGLVGLSGGSLPRRLRLSIQTLSLATLGFALWFLQQSIYDIGSLCILCIFCFIGLIFVNWSWLRTNADDLPLSARRRAWLKRFIAADGDSIAWSILAAVVALAMLLRFY